MSKSSPNHTDLYPDTYEWAHLGAQAVKSPEAFTAQADAEGISNPELFTAEVAEIGNAASWDIVLAHQGLIKSAANRYIGMISRSPALDFSDLVSAGMEAVHGTAGSYFPKKERFSAGGFFYRSATWGIRKAIDDHSSTVRLPRNVRQTLRRVDRLAQYRDPSTGAGINPARIFELVGASEEKTRKRLELARLVSYEMGSIDNGFSPQVDNPSENDYSQRMESVFDTGQPNYLEIAELTARSNQIRELLPQLGLSDRELLILRLRLGISGDGNTRTMPMTLEETGEIIGLSKDRIRQIENKALSSLRKPANADKLCPPETVTRRYIVPRREYVDRDGTTRVLPARIQTHKYRSRVIE